MPFPGFVDEFTNSPVQPAYSSFLNVVVPAVVPPATFVNVPLEWSFANPNTLYPFSQFIKVATNASALNIINFPDATMTSVSQSCIIYNASANVINIYTYTDPIAGAVLIVSIPVGDAVTIWCTDNTTTQGQWQSIALGSGSSVITASDLIDPTTSGAPYNFSMNGGLGAFLPHYLKLNMNVNTVSTGAAYTQQQADRGSVLLWETGTGVYTCLPSATLGNGFMWAINNGGATAGEISVTPIVGETIDDIYTNTNPFILDQGQSCFFFTKSGVGFYTVGLSSSQGSGTSLIIIPVTGALTLTTDQVKNLILEFTGTAGGTQTITFPNTGTYTNYIWNNSNSTLNLILTGSVLAPIPVPVGERLIVFSDSHNLYLIPTTDIAPEFPDGTQAAPSITFINDTALGLYRNTTTQPAPATDSLTIVQANTSVIDFTNNGVYPNVQLLGAVASSNNPTYSFKAQPTSGMLFTGTAPIGIQFVAAGVEVLRMTSAPQVLAPLGLQATPSYSFTGNPGTGMWAGLGGASIFLSATGSQVFGADSTLLNLSSNGAVAIQIMGTTNINTFLPILAPVSATPSYSFTGFTTTGMYLNASILGLSNQGNSILTASNTITNIWSNNVVNMTFNNNTNITTTIPFYAPNGAVATPSYAFANKTNTGMFYDGTYLNFSFNGVSIMNTNGNVTTFNLSGAYVFNIGGVAYFNIGGVNYNYTYADMNAHSSALHVNGATFRQEDINIYSLMRAYG